MKTYLCVFLFCSKFEIFSDPLRGYSGLLFYKYDTEHNIISWSWGWILEDKAVLCI